MRASIGASEQQLNATSDILGIQVQNFTAAQSQIQDANIADEVVNLTKFQILQQSGTSALSKSNQNAQQVLALLQ
jgi:flagellin